MELNDFVKQLNSAIASDGPAQNEVIIPAVKANVSSATPMATMVPNKTLKILIVSTHINQANGYSKVSYNIINQLSTIPWIKVVHFGTQMLGGGNVGRKYPENVTSIDASALEKQKQIGFAFAELPTVIMNEKPDVVLIYNDMSVICAYVEEIKKAIQKRFFKLWAYVDITYKSPPSTMIDLINRDIERIFCFTQTWKDELKSCGITRPIDVMNHAINTDLIRQIPRELARSSLGLPTDIFMFTSLNKNIPRKRLDLLIMAFVKLITRFPMKPLFLLIVADKGDKGGFQLFDIFARELKLNNASTNQFGNRLLITTANNYYTDEDINLLYNCGDVGVSCADGEGFGLCTFEQMYLGVPQIVPNINGYNEYCNDNNSLMITPKMRCYIPQAHNTVIGELELVDIEDVSKAMGQYVFDEELRKIHGKLAKETVGEYTWTKSCAVLLKRLSRVLEDDD
jgi:glycosyltransferase involved in cell wall biosynthesis